ncbi:hypothetical protein LJC16_02480 [Bacteroidales bacterium OttesenSCG-928-C19]|nr:hypothetical protein [Bacteroidales bacterium OttesenSCG-928-C19]
MKLKDDFFTIIEDQSLNKNDVEYKIQLKASHPVYKAHFPNNPITPGVYIIQMAAELASEFLKCELRLKKADKIRFQNVINPLENSILNAKFTIHEDDIGSYKAAVNIFNENDFFAKLSLTLIAL